VKTSVFDLFKIGVGPSSSHTVGPMRAAAQFARETPGAARFLAELYGSLALTGVGHGTDRAVLLGLAGCLPGEIVSLDSAPPAAPSATVVFHRDRTLPEHPNGMRFTAYDATDRTMACRTFYSTGGGFIREAGCAEAGGERPPVPYPFSSGTSLIERANEHGLAIWQLMLENEKAWRPEAEIVPGILRFWQVMKDCTWRGLHTEGILPGGLNVRRRAPRLYEKLVHGGSKDPLGVMDWVNVYAMAVNEENAAGGRVVTAPTNGAAGVIPAVAHYYIEYMAGDSEGIVRYFLTAGAIGVLYKENASISGAEVGCQGEVGVACSMAAAGLVAAQGGTNEQIEHAAEIGMEHNLGMTCDPIGGLVQIPCIERNAIGAVKAINAARMAMQETSGHHVSLDQVIRTMYQTGLDMQSKYKETSLAGLAVLAVSRVEC